METRTTPNDDDTWTPKQRQQGGSADDCDWCRPIGGPADLECQALVAEQARELAHRLRSPLGAIDMVCESLALEQPDSEITERLQVVLRASAKLKQVLDETVSAVVPRWPTHRSMDLAAACSQFADADGLNYAPNTQAPVWIAAAPPDGELALWQALSLARLGSRNGQVRLDLIAREFTRGTTTGGATATELESRAELSLTPMNPLGPLDERLDGEMPLQSLAFLRLKRLRRFAAEQGGVLEIEPSRLLLRLPAITPTHPTGQ
ncbi:hypothetical protein [Rhabdochromatium marinum]|uniref:hypothetical protein n=1 Tax=Rhabdochromatium marinum TaxID=48729 RepID=UPI001908C136|nr:hypothetical protein [Rhabdochromatium marinum]MBK1650359.1 hypothetical protein [Rhabdochromatium marinum]